MSECNFSPSFQFVALWSSISEYNIHAGYSRNQRALQSSRRIAITTHAKPDGDAIGSSMALFHYLRKKGHKVDVVVPTIYADFLKWLPDNDKILVGPEDPDRASWIFEGLISSSALTSMACLGSMS